MHCRVKPVSGESEERMSFQELILRLIRALVLWAVLAGTIFFALHVLSVLSGWICGIEWIAIATLFLMHLLAAAIGPLFWNQEREDCRK